MPGSSWAWSCQHSGFFLSSGASPAASVSPAAISPETCSPSARPHSGPSTPCKAKPLLEKYSAIKVTAYSMAAGTVLLLPIGAYELLHQSWTAVSVRSWTAFAFSTFISGGIAFTLWYQGVQRIGVSRTIVYHYIVPFVAVLFAALFLGETDHPPPDRRRHLHSRRRLSRAEEKTRRGEEWSIGRSSCPFLCVPLPKSRPGQTGKIIDRITG